MIEKSEPFSFTDRQTNEKCAGSFNASLEMETLSLNLHHYQQMDDNAP